MSRSIYSAAYRDSARRQFRISLFMVIALALGALSSSFVSPRVAAPDVAQENGFAGRLAASVDR